MMDKNLVSFSASYKQPYSYSRTTTDDKYTTHTCNPRCDVDTCSNATSGVDQHYCSRSGSVAVLRRPQIADTGTFVRTSFSQLRSWIYKHFTGQRGVGCVQRMIQRQQRYTRKTWQRHGTDTSATYNKQRKHTSPYCPISQTSNHNAAASCGLRMSGLMCCRILERVNGCSMCKQTSYSGCMGIILILEKWRVIFSSGDMDDTVVFATFLEKP